MRALAATALLAASFLLPATADAIPVSYQMVFKVDYIDATASIPPAPQIAIGNQYYGSFTVDDGLLATDGANQAGTVFDFLVQIENVSWDFANPNPGSAFSGFRGPGGLGSGSPGFDVLNGEIVNLRGGVFGSGDVPFVDFSTDLRLPFVEDPACAGTAYCGNAANSFFTLNSNGGFGGSMRVARAIPEPSAPMLATLGLLAFASASLLRRRRK